MIQCGFFSQKHYDYNKANLTPNIREVIHINRNYPSVGAEFLGAYFKTPAGIEVLVTHVSWDKPLQLYEKKWDDIIELGEITEFVRYSEYLYI